jgi:hypothetical protein
MKVYFNLFDYIWYRIAKVYYKWDSDGMTASAFLSLSQGVLLGNIIHFASLRLGFYDFVYHNKNLEFLSNIEVIIGFVLLFLNYRLYQKRYWICRDRWLKEGKGLSYYLKALAVLAFLILPWVWFAMLVPYKI